MYIITKLEVATNKVEIIDVEPDPEAGAECQSIIYDAIHDMLTENSNYVSTIEGKTEFHVYERCLIYGKTLAYIFYICEFNDQNN